VYNIKSYKGKTFNVVARIEISRSVARRPSFVASLVGRRQEIVFCPLLLSETEASRSAELTRALTLHPRYPLHYALHVACGGNLADTLVRTLLANSYYFVIDVVVFVSCVAAEINQRTEPRIIPWPQERVSVRLPIANL